jgi:hypothetical protein
MGEFQLTGTGGDLNCWIDQATPIVVDERWKTVEPPGRGELWIAGQQVATSYIGNVRETIARFVPAPAHDGFAFRTGDLVELTSAGEVRILGRLDVRDVKVNGIRVMMTEIEDALTTVSGVEAAHVEALPIHQSTSHKLIAFVVGSSDLASREIRRELRKSLPLALVPSHFVPVDAIPQLPSGKRDLASLRSLAESVASGDNERWLVHDPPAVPHLETFVVVRGLHGAFRVWPAAGTPPSGWKPTSRAMSYEDSLDQACRATIGLDSADDAVTQSAT